MKLFLHAGLSKTGTSSIQTFFAQRRKEYISKYNFLYPKTGTGFTKNDNAHHVFSLSFEKKLGISVNITSTELLLNLEREIINSKCTKALISSEIMPVVFNSIEFKNFVMRNNISVHLIFTIRQQSEILRGLVSQIICDSASDFHATLFSIFLSNKEFFDYNSTIKHWETTKMADSITLLPYSESILSSFVSFVLERPYNKIDLLQVKWKNRSILYNRILVLHKIKEKLLISKSYSSQLFNEVVIDINKISENFFLSPTLWFSAEEQYLFNTLFSKSNELLIAKYPFIESIFTNNHKEDMYAYTKLNNEGTLLLANGRLIDTLKETVIE